MQKKPLSLYIETLIIVFLMVLTVEGQPVAAKGENYPNNPPDKALERRRVCVGVYENKPKVFSGEKGRAAGIFIEILEAVAEGEKWELSYVHCDWPECLRALKEGQIDLMPDVAISPERVQQFDFHEELVIESWTQIYAGKDAGIKKMSDLNRRSVALLKDSIQEKILEQLARGFGYQCVIVEANTYEEAFSLARDGRVDAAVSNYLFGDYWYQEYGLVKTPVVFNPVSLFFASAKGCNADLLHAIDFHLKSMKAESGSIYYKALGRWMERPPRVVTQKRFFWGMAGFSGFILLTVIIIFVLRTQLRARTGHLFNVNEKLRESEKRYRNLFETMTQGVVYQDSQGAILSANPAAEQILGLSLDEMWGLTSTSPNWQAIHEDGAPFPGEDHPGMVALRTGNTVSGVVMGITHPKTKQTRWIVISAIPSFHPGDPKPVHVFAIFADITERKMAEESLRNQHEELSQIFQTFPDALIYADVERRIMRVNPAFVKIFGHEPEGVIGQETSVIYAWREDFVEQGLNRYHAGAAPSLEPYQVHYRRANGEIFIGETIGSPIRDTKGIVIGMFAVVRDITERRNLEFQLQQAQKMESVGRLAGGVAHDFNNLLSVILGYSELLLVEADQATPQYHRWEQVVQAALRARDLVRQLLVFSRKQVLEMKPVDLNQLLTGFEKMLSRVIGEDIELVLVLSSDHPWVVGDTGQLEQVVMNLAVNARDAMPQGGVLTIKTAVTKLSDRLFEKDVELPPGEYAMLGVSDTGFGMEKDILEKIFEPFFTTKEREKGSGLGLATSYGIIKQHGGAITVSSILNSGTAFRIYLPLVKGHEIPKEKEREALSDLKGWETILLVEDNEMVRNIAFTILEEKGYTILTAESGEEALASLKNYAGPIHLVLTDVVMPGMNGVELVERLSGRFPHIKALFMSGYSDDLIVHRGILEKGSHFIQKPFSIHALAEKVREILNDTVA